VKERCDISKSKTANERRFLGEKKFYLVFENVRIQRVQARILFPVLGSMLHCKFGFFLSQFTGL